MGKTSRSRSRGRSEWAALAPDRRAELSSGLKALGIDVPSDTPRSGDDFFDCCDACDEALDAAITACGEAYGSGPAFERCCGGAEIAHDNCLRKCTGKHAAPKS